MGKSTSFSLNIGNKTRLSAFTTVIQHGIKSLHHSNQTTEKIKGIHIKKEEVKLSLFANDMCIENPKDSTKKTTRTDKLIQ